MHVDYICMCMCVCMWYVWYVCCVHFIPHILVFTVTASPSLGMTGQDTSSPVLQQGGRGEEEEMGTMGTRRSSDDSESEVYFNTASEAEVGVAGAGDSSQGAGLQLTPGTKDTSSTSYDPAASSPNLPTVPSLGVVSMGTTPSGSDVSGATSHSRGDMRQNSTVPENPIEEARRKAEERKRGDLVCVCVLWGGGYVCVC